MEFIIFIVVIWIISAIWNALTKASGNSAVNTEFSVRVVEERIGDAQLPIWAVQIRGLLPIQRPVKLAATTSLFDVTDGGNRPVLASIDDFQEPNGYAFFFLKPLGLCQPMYGSQEWVTVGMVPKDLLMYPIPGERKIKVQLRLINIDNPPQYRAGFVDNTHPGILAQRQETVQVRVERGYEEKSDEELGVAAASIRLAVRLALADGRLDDSEGMHIREWARMYVESVPGAEGQAKAKEFLNEAIRWALKDGAENISISDQIAVLNKLAGKPEKYAAMELCLDVMAADGIADRKESEMLNSLCKSLNLDANSFRDMKDKRLMNVKQDSFGNEDVWGRLDIDAKLPDAEKKRLLNTLYRKWNSRAESLEEAAERDKAQQMLELIAQARHKLN